MWKVVWWAAEQAAHVDDVAVGMEADGDSLREELWPGDCGTLQEQSRRALLALIKGPYLSGRSSPRLWTALVSDTDAIRSRLNDMFLDLVMDPIEEFAYTVQPQNADGDIPKALRSEKMSFIDTAMLLVMRQLTLSAEPGERIIVGKDELSDALSIYRTSDAVTFQKNVNAAWTRMHNKYRLLHTVGTDRSEISPMVRHLVGEDRVKALMATYQALTVPEGGEDADE